MFRFEESEMIYQNPILVFCEGFFFLEVFVFAFFLEESAFTEAERFPVAEASTPIQKQKVSSSAGKRKHHPKKQNTCWREHEQKKPYYQGL